MKLAALALMFAAMPQADPAPPRSVDGLPLGGIPRQELPTHGCATFLWTATQTRALVAMMTSEPGQLRFAPDGHVTDLVRTVQNGPGELGFLAHSEYAGGPYKVVVEMEISTRPDLTQGGIARNATLRIDRDGSDTLIVPVVGIIGCAG